MIPKVWKFFLPCCCYWNDFVLVTLFLSFTFTADFLTLDLLPGLLCFPFFGYCFSFFLSLSGSPGLERWERERELVLVVNSEVKRRFWFVRHCVQSFAECLRRFWLKISLSLSLSLVRFASLYVWAKLAICNNNKVAPALYFVFPWTSGRTKWNGPSLSL